MKYIITILIAILIFSGNILADIMNGRILEVNKEFNFVIINLGKEDGVKKGTQFLVYREKKLIGKIEAEDVFQDMSSCIILSWYKQEDIKVDDGVLKP